MPEESNTITITRPVSDVFAFLADAENDKQWRSGIIEMTRTGGEGVGATYRQIVAGLGGRRIDADIEITEFVPDQRPRGFVGERLVRGRPFRRVTPHVSTLSPPRTPVTTTWRAATLRLRRPLVPHRSRA